MEASVERRRAETGAAAPVARLSVAENERMFGLLLSYVAGYVDTAGFLTLFGLFPAHVTGNLVDAAIALAAHGHAGTFARLAMIPAFMGAVALSAVVSRRERKRGRAPTVHLLMLLTIALAAFGATGTLVGRFATGPDDWGVLLIGGTAVAAMGVQSTLMRQALGACCATTVMTGNLTQFTIELVEMALDSFRRRNGEARLRRAPAGPHLVRSGLPVIAFLFGALMGAGFTRRFGLESIAVPTLAAGWLSNVARRAAPAPQAGSRRRFRNCRSWRRPARSSPPFAKMAHADCNVERQFTAGPAREGLVVARTGTARRPSAARDEACRRRRAS